MASVDDASVTSEPGAPEADGVVSLASAHGFADTVRRLLAAFEEHGIHVFVVIDQQAEALRAGLTLPPTTLILFGNPKAGTALMLREPRSALDLPLKVLVSEAPSKEVSVAFNAASYVIRRHGLPEQLAANLRPAERLIANALR